MGKLRKQIEIAARRRAKHGRPQAEQVTKLTVSPAQQKAFSDQYAKTLLRMESVIVQTAAELQDGDDFVVEQALRAAIRSHAADDPSAQLLVAVLDAWRQSENLDEGTWRTGLRVLYTSVTSRSDCRRGEFNYLNFAAQFVSHLGGR